MFRRSLTVLGLPAAICAIAAPGLARAADLCLDMPIQCNGFEPNWRFVTDVDGEGGTTVRFTDPENPSWETEPLVIESCLLQGSPNDFELSTPEPLALIASIVEQSCVEPNDDVLGFSVTATFNQGALTPNPNRVEGTGCCKRLD
jgi:hypothetical protein